MTEKKSLDQLTRSGLHSRLSRYREKLEERKDALRHAEVDDRICSKKHKELRTIQKNIRSIQAKMAEVISYLEIE